MRLYNNSLLDQIDTPALLCDYGSLTSNIAEMQYLANSNGVSVRPHIKSHKTVEIARLQTENGACGITVSKLGEAEVFAEHGFDDILTAYPIIGEFKIKRLINLSEKVEKLRIIIDSFEAAQELNAELEKENLKIEYLAAVDTGFHRCGIEPNEKGAELIQRLQDLKNLKYKGLMSHSGHIYSSAGNQYQRRKIAHEEAAQLITLKNLLEEKNISSEIRSVGSTPAAKIIMEYPGITEIRPGNYVFYDAVQTALGSCTIDQCSLSVVSQVISHNFYGYSIIDAGSKVFGLDKGTQGSDFLTGYGHIYNKENYYIEKLSEEHGFVSHIKEKHRTLRLKEKLQIIPNHACSCVNMFDFMYVISEGKIIDKWQIAARGKVT